MPTGDRSSEKIIASGWNMHAFMIHEGKETALQQKMMSAPGQTIYGHDGTYTCTYFKKGKEKANVYGVSQSRFYELT